LVFLKTLYHTSRFWIVATLLSIVLGTLGMIASLVDRSGGTTRDVASLWGRWLCSWNGIRVEVEGLEYAAPGRARVFVANHQSCFDIFALAGFLPARMIWVAKSSLFHIPFVGWTMRAAGYVSVEREDKKKAYQSFLDTVEKLRSGFSIVIFPEGTRSADGKIGEFKKGGQLLALRSKTPMVPVTIIGSGKIIKKGGVAVNPGPIKVILSPPIAVNELSADEQEKILEVIRNIIRKNYEEHTFA
jgi:1-acyl-sn-glycerol-3-phosphate acyltransferase